MPLEVIPVGICQCGCGQPTEVYKFTSPTHGFVKGQFKDYVRKHKYKPIVGPKHWSENFWRHVDKTQTELQWNGTPCWLWTGSQTSGGYGHFNVHRQVGGFATTAHRVAYELLIGPIPNGHTIDHLCRHILCVNPAHLEPVTQLTNLLRGNTVNAVNAAKTHCKHGHEFTPENTYYAPGRNARACKTCLREQSRLSYHRKRGLP